MLIIVVFVICFKPAFPFLEYVLNYNYIANELCINKDNLALNCNGKCYLMSKLAEESKQEHSDKSFPLESSFSFVFFQDIKELFSPSFFKIYKLNKFLFNSDSYSYNFHQELIKPPII